MLKGEGAALVTGWPGEPQPYEVIAGVLRVGVGQSAFYATEGTNMAKRKPLTTAKEVPELSGGVHGFKAIAPYLSNPLVLVGFALFVLAGFYETLILSGVIPKLEATAASPIVAAVVNNLFWASIVIIVLGLLLAHRRRR